jgi:hypothetical protein
VNTADGLKLASLLRSTAYSGSADAELGCSAEEEPTGAPARRRLVAMTTFQAALGNPDHAKGARYSWYTYGDPSKGLKQVVLATYWLPSSNLASQAGSDENDYQALLGKVDHRVNVKAADLVNGLRRSTIHGKGPKFVKSNLSLKGNVQSATNAYHRIAFAQGLLLLRL